MAEIHSETDFFLCSISLEDHLKESLGQPIQLPEDLQEAFEEDWADSSEPSLLEFLSRTYGKRYERVYRDNSCNYESDLDAFFVYTVYAPANTFDWTWEQDCFLSIETGEPGDPRYVSYSPATVYQVGDCTGENGFLNWRLSWRAEPTRAGMDTVVFNRWNDRFQSGYSPSPSSMVSESCYETPIWCEKRKAHVGRIVGTRCPCLFTPYH